MLLKILPFFPGLKQCKQKVENIKPKNGNDNINTLQHSFPYYIVQRHRASKKCEPVNQVQNHMLRLGNIEMLEIGNWLTGTNSYQALEGEISEASCLMNQVVIHLIYLYINQLDVVCRQWLCGMGRRIGRTHQKQVI